MLKIQEQSPQTHLSPVKKDQYWISKEKEILVESLTAAIGHKLLNLE